MTLNILFRAFCLVALVVQEQRCDDAVIYNATYAVQTWIKGYFPQDIEFNESCVAEGCPALKNFSFCQSDLGINALRDITKTLSKCMSAPICGIVFDPRPVNHLLVSMDEFLPGSPVTGIATTPPGAGILSNISDIQLESSSNENQYLPRQMTMVIPNIRIHGDYAVNFHLKTGLGVDLTVNLSHSTYDIRIQFTSIVIVNLTGPNVDFNFINSTVKTTPQLCGIDLPTGFPNVVAPFTESLQMIYDNSIMATSIGRLMGKLYRSAIQVALSNCKSLNVTI